MVEVILKKEVRKLGDRGEIVKVKPGYARNYLFPRSLAMPATAATKDQIAQMQAAAEKEVDLLRTAAGETAELMKDLTIRIVAKAGDTNQLFGSVTTRQIAAELAELGFEVDRQKIILEAPIKEVGDFEVRVHHYKEVRSSVKIEVRAEGREDEKVETAEEKQAAVTARQVAAMSANQSHEESDEAAEAVSPETEALTEAEEGKD
jgi:large subunit ribosomal protein L9